MTSKAQWQKSTYVNLLMSSAVPKDMTLEEMQQATTEDVTFQCLMHLTQKQEWHNLDKLPQHLKDADTTELTMFKRMKDELTINDLSNKYRSSWKLYCNTQSSSRQSNFNCLLGSSRSGEN